MWEEPGQPCHIQAYTVYTPIGGKGRCCTSSDLQDHSSQARKSAGEIFTLDLKPMRKDTRSPKQEQSVAPQNGPWSNKKRRFSVILSIFFPELRVILPLWNTVPEIRTICGKYDISFFIALKLELDPVWLKNSRNTDRVFNWYYFPQFSFEPFFFKIQKHRKKCVWFCINTHNVCHPSSQTTTCNRDFHDITQSFHLLWFLKTVFEEQLLSNTCQIASR